MTTNPRRSRTLAYLGICLIASLVLGIQVIGERGRAANALPALVSRVASPPIDHAALSAGADASWWQAVSAELERQEYDLSPTDDGYQAPNRAQNLRTSFVDGGIQVGPRTTKNEAPAWRFGWQTTGFGRPGTIEEVSPSAPSAAGARVVYERDGWQEWYENTANGLEQGFSIERRPAGEGPLQITGTFPVTLRPELRSDGAVDFLDDHDVRVLRYGELHVWDAEEKDLPAELVVAANTLAIEIDDRDADYPLSVDPLMTSPAWSAESDQAGASFGSSVATAGDVNGDGFSDVIVGAPAYDNGQPDAGKAFVFHGSAAGLATSPAWTVASDQNGGNFGAIVATAGDVNGDGFCDIIIGAPNYSNGQSFEGRAYVYHGSPAGVATTPAWINESDQATARFGRSALTAGDVNGDGFSDVIVGANQYDNGETDEGRAFVYHGSPAGLGATAAWTGESNLAGAEFGFSVSTAGDVNGDGFSDVIVGSQRYSNGETNEGRAYVYHGSATGLAANAAWAPESNQSGALFGWSVSTAGDVNGDGFSDVLVGALFYDNGQSDEGRVFAYHGSAAGLSTTPAWTNEPNQADARYGHSVATAGDVNGDGFSDVIVGAYAYDNGELQEGRAFAYLGSAVGLAAAPFWTIESNQTDGFFGSSVATAGDVNGDGFSDVIVGASSYDNGQTNEGRAFVYCGSAAGLATSSAWTAELNVANKWFGGCVANVGDVNGNGFSDVFVSGLGGVRGYYGGLTGPATTASWTKNDPDASFGESLSAAGDVNGDGYADLIIGNPGYENGQTNEGRAYVYYGSATGLSTTLAWFAESNQAEANFGCSVSTAGDVNGDGFSDVIVGARMYDNGESDEGRAYLYLGSASGLASTPAWTAESNQAGASFGACVSTAGDVNGDGFSDVIVGTGLYDNGQVDEGRAFAYYGSAAGLTATPAWSAESNLANSRFGDCVATAGDVNGDGFSDVIVGAWQYLTAPNNEGGAFVYQGSASGLITTPAWSMVTPFGRFGWTASSAGDVNGDGFSDVVVGAYGYGNGELGEGAAFVYHGSAAGLATTAAWTAESNQAQAWFGECVATAGDVNGDGFSDVIVGAPHYDNGEQDEGRAFVYLGNEGDGLDRAARQGQSDNVWPINVLGQSDSPTSFRLKATGRTAWGRGKVQLQWEVKPMGTPFNGIGLGSGTAFDTGVPSFFGSRVDLSDLVTGLTSNTVYHWRLRISSPNFPFFPRTPWLTLPDNNRTEADLRTAAGTTGIEQAETPPGALLLEAAQPNPVTVSTEIAYTLPMAGRVQLAIYDVTGRERLLLANAIQGAGRQKAIWNGRDARGAVLPSGVYFARLEFGGRVESRKITLAR